MPCSSRGVAQLLLPSAHVGVIGFAGSKVGVAAPVKMLAIASGVSPSNAYCERPSIVKGIGALGIGCQRFGNEIIEILVESATWVALPKAKATRVSNSLVHRVRAAGGSETS